MTVSPSTALQDVPAWWRAVLDVQPNGLTPGGPLPATLAGAADSHAKLPALPRTLSPR